MIDNSQKYERKRTYLDNYLTKEHIQIEDFPPKIHPFGK